MIEFSLFFVLICLFFFLPVQFRIFYQKLARDDCLILEMNFLWGIFKRKRSIKIIEPSLAQVTTKREFFKKNWFFRKKAEVVEKSSLSQDVPVGFQHFWDRFLHYGLGLTLLSYLVPAPYHHWLLVVEDLEKKGRFQKFVWITWLGTGDSALTAIGYGVLWGLKCSILNYIDQRLISIENQEIKVIPDYREKRFDMVFDCIFSVKLGYIIIASLIARIRHRALKGGAEIE